MKVRRTFAQPSTDEVWMAYCPMTRITLESANAISLLQHLADEVIAHPERMWEFGHSSLFQICEATINHGPGHQSRTKCDRKGPHNQHHARPMGDDVYWSGSTATTGFFNESPEDAE